jgi:signal transduction histidine kinase
MSLRVFILNHHEEIIREFAAFAKTLMPAGAAMSDPELRDHAEEILTAIGHDMGTAQTIDEQTKKSQGLGTAQAMAAAGRLHADSRIHHGFPVGAILAEFRALRAVVLRLYQLSGASDLAEVRRFNESVDEALTVSLTRFTAQADLFRDQFIGILSHDLRNPLGAITTGAAMMAVPEDDPQRRARVAATITNSAQRMERLIADFLDLTQIKLGGPIPLTRRRTHLQHVCEDVMREIRTAHRDVVLRLETSGNLVGEWDADRFSQVVSNLVGNGIQHGEGTPVTLAAHGEGDRVTLAVHNGGAPIPAEAMPLIFEPLARGQAENATGSHSIGLGLFIARAIVSAHGGQITVTSSSDLGTTFKVVLPRNDSSKSSG